MFLTGPAAKSSSIGVHIHRWVLVGMKGTQTLEDITPPRQFDVFLDDILDGIRITDPFELVVARDSVHLFLSLTATPSGWVKLASKLLTSLTSQQRPFPTPIQIQNDDETSREETSREISSGKL
jgi:hypothetical protein